MNGNHGKSHYAMQVLNPKEDINYPTEAPVAMNEHFYKTVVDQITDNLLGIKLDEEYVNSLLSVLKQILHTFHLPLPKENLQIFPCLTM